MNMKQSSPEEEAMSKMNNNVKPLPREQLSALHKDGLKSIESLEQKGEHIHIALLWSIVFVFAAALYLGFNNPALNGPNPVALALPFMFGGLVIASVVCLAWIMVYRVFIREPLLTVKREIAEINNLSVKTPMKDNG